MFERADEHGEPLFHGIEYGSRFGDEFQNWAIFERPELTVENVTVRDIDVNDPQFQAALRVLGLKLG